MHNKFSVLDLSNNKFTGELADGISNERLLNNSGMTSSISMKVNRLSGYIPYSSSMAYDKVIFIYFIFSLVLLIILWFFFI